MAAGIALAALCATVALGACGPVRYVGDVNRRAADAVEAAREARAERYAPYWWTRALAYLHKAREVAAHADFQGASRFGRLAADAADRAAQEAAVAARDPSQRPLDDQPDVAPAKEAPLAPPSPVAPAKDRP